MTNPVVNSSVVKYPVVSRFVVSTGTSVLISVNSGSGGSVVGDTGSSDGFLHSISITVGIVIPIASNVKAAVNISSFFAKLTCAEKYLEISITSDRNHGIFWDKCCLKLGPEGKQITFTIK